MEEPNSSLGKVFTCWELLRSPIWFRFEKVSNSTLFSKALCRPIPFIQGRRRSLKDLFQQLFQVEMSCSLYIPLKEGLLELAHSISTDREASFSQTPLSPALPPIPPSDLTNQVKAVWEQSQSEEGSSNGRWVEIVRSVLDLLGRDMVVTPFVNGDVSQDGLL